VRHEAVVEASRVQAPLAALIKEIGGGPKSARDLDTRRAQALFSAMLAGEVPPLELGAILIALRIKGESLPEMIGFLRALDEAVGRLDADPERPRPVVLPSYNGARRHPNLTALLALLLRRYGVPVVIHGPDGHSADDGADGEDAEAQSIAIDPRAKRVTTLDVLRALGIEPAASMADAQRMLERQSLAYVPTLVLAPSLATLLACRDRLGVRSCAHSLAKLIDPFHGDAVRVVSVTHPAYLERMRELLVATRVRALLLRATEGEPYANPLRQVQIEAYADGIGTVCAEKECGSVTEPPRLPALDAGATAAWIAEALDGTVAVPASIVAQLACCLDATRRI
jgi:anthranilate phosphoribosyltransferase